MKLFMVFLVFVCLILFSVYKNYGEHTMYETLIVFSSVGAFVCLVMFLGKILI